MIVAVTGATGFVGRHLVARLRERGHRLRILARDPARLPFPPTAVEAIRGDLTDPKALHALAAGADALVHLVGIIAETGRQTFRAIHVDATNAVLAAVQAAGIRRYVHMSAIGARPDPGATAYHRSKWQAEEAVRRSGVGVAIIRPTFIVGPENVPLRLLARLHYQLPAVPVFGDGRFPLQPIWIGDVTQAFALALERQDLSGTWEIGGPDRLSYAEFVRAIGRAVGRPRPLVHVPLGLARLAAAAFDLLPAGVAPITSDQLQMLVEGSVTGENTIERVFGVTPMPLEESLRRSLGSPGRSATAAGAPAG